MKKPNYNKIVESIENQMSNISLTYDCNITPRRASQLNANRQKHDNLKKLKDIFCGLNDGWENLNDKLKMLKNKSDIELIINETLCYPTESIIANATWNKESKIKIKNKLQKLDIHNDDDLIFVRNKLNDFLIDMSKDEKQKREIMKIEDELRTLKIPGFFPTPKELIDEMIEHLNLTETDTILEPSAGKGDIIDALKNKGYSNVECCEVSETLRKILKFKNHKVVEDNFLNLNKKYTKIIMNPPFENGQDIDHIYHAYNLLHYGGTLVTIMSTSPFFKSDKKSISFREWLETKNYKKINNNQGAFKKSFNSTMVNTCMVIINKI